VVTIITGNTYLGTLCVTTTQGRDEGTHITVHITTLRQRRQVSVVTANLFLRGQPKRKLRDRQLGPFTVEEQIGKHGYILKFSAIVRLHHVFHVNNLRPGSTAPLRPAVPMGVLERDDEELDVSHIFVVCVKSLP
jgi:hypothetical protein